MKKHQSMFENPMHIEIESDMIIAFSTFMERPIIVRQMMIYMHSISTHLTPIPKVAHTCVSE